ncbi:MAG: hypothetical protein E8D44_10155 [Nitrospira sp.]|nr:MAG: hypothetical protein E8D44_10155 [Nitrospira sp.]
MAVRILTLTRPSVMSIAERATANLWTLALLLPLAIGAVSCGDVSNAPAPAPGPGALTITTSSLPDGTVNQPYAWTLGGSGGTTPYNWSVTPALPANLQLDTATGAITGTPVAQSSTTYTFSLRDSSVPNQTIQKPLLLTINSAPVPPTITTTSLPSGTINQIYPPNTTLQATGGVPPYTWSVSPALPTWLQLDAATGTLSGTPTATATITRTYTVRDSTLPTNRTTSRSITIRVRN